VCYFEDNRQCEEWALLRGDCPVGGLKVTGYITPAAQYCVITGGTYAITGNNGADDEQGTCTLKDGTICDVWDYYNGACTTGRSASEWQTYTDADVGYSVQTPPTWSQQTLPDQNDGAIHGTAFNGTEGGVEVYWGIGFGGACTTGTEPVQLAQGEVQTCHATQSDGTEVWSQIGYEVSGGNSFSARAFTNDAQSSSHDLVLQVLATLTFMPPTTSGLIIQPLSMEVCDGQAQAMTHTLDVLVGTPPGEPFIATLSEESISDTVNNASGTGCQATVTGTGTQFESPLAVVNALGDMLLEQGWTADPMLVADGPTGTSTGYRKGDQICWASARWEPDASANCPQDQAVSACQVTPQQQNYTVTLNSGVELPPGGAAATPAGTPLLGGGAGQIVFDSDRAGIGVRDLYVMNSDGYDLSRLTRGEANSYAGPWSPDGQRIAYTSYDGGVTETYIAVINADGSGKTIIDQINGSDEGFPDWSPDGTQIAFTSRRDGNNEIYLMNADGSNPVRLTDSPADDFAPSWSPDGTKIVFVSDRDQQPGVNDLFIMNADGSEVTHLTDDAALDYSPDWSPDGKTIVFRSDLDGQSDIYVINVDGSDRHKLTDNPAYDWSPAWSPDGKYIAFQTERDGNFEIYLMTADGADPINLSNDPGYDQMPYWRP
jgi:putative hemolysin